MNRGKDICKELKAVRRQIAAENGIDLEIPECTYHGACPGTCPRCESEVRFLENELAKRIKLGKVATVAGLALTLSATAQAQDVAPRQQQAADSVKVERKVAMYEVKGSVVDEKTREPLPFVNVVVMRDGKQVHGATTDFDGNFKLRLPEGEYDFEIVTVGYARYIRTGVKVPMEQPLEVELKNDATPIDQIIEVGGSYFPIIDIGPEGGMNTNIQGVPLYIQY
ncbi:MAG: carboxypeptidase-like regulatory domain-containing protein [Bacteroidales bacterium]|nr:carboxypeptidase-like regulatory domain-containing protein [Bacteroidales bacterium]